MSILTEHVWFSDFPCLRLTHTLIYLSIIQRTPHTYRNKGVFLVVEMYTHNRKTLFNLASVYKYK